MNLECTIATREALVVICEHEKIPYTTGYGPDGYVLCIPDDSKEKFKDIIRQWRDVILNVYFIGMKVSEK